MNLPAWNCRVFSIAPVLKHNVCRCAVVSAVAGAMIVGCGGGSITSDIPELSGTVPALPDDASAEGSTLPEAAVVVPTEVSSVVPTEVPTEVVSNDLSEPTIVQADPTADVADSGSTLEPTDNVQTLDIEVVTIPATGVGLSAQAEALLASATKRGGVRILPAGDSITQGIGGSASYRRELASMLDAAGCSYRMVGSQSQSLPDTGYYGAHEGYSGHTADNFLTGQQTNSGNNAGIADAVSFQSPDIIFLHIGSVDLFLGQTVDSTVADIAAVIDAVYQTKPDAVVVVANVIPSFSEPRGVNLPYSIRILGNKIQELVQSSSNPLLSLADVRTGFSEDMMQSDLIHPNLDGDVHIANAVFDSFFSSSSCS